MDQTTRTSIIIHKALHPRNGRDRLHVSRKGGGLEFANIEDGIHASIQRLEEHMQKSKVRLR